MSINLTITLIIISLILITLISHFLRIGRIPEKYALLWYLFSIIIMVISFFPGIFVPLAKLLGFQLLSNMVLVFLIGILFLVTISLTIMIAGQRKKTTLLIQEISILKENVNKLEKK